MVGFRIRSAIVGLVFASLVAGSAWAEAGESFGGTHFGVPPELRPAVNFWKDVFARYSKYEVAIHDTERLDRVYSVLDFTDLPGRGWTEGEIEQHAAQTTKAEKERIRALLMRLDRTPGGPSRLSSEERRIWNLFQGSSDPRRFYRAAAEDRIRAQTGLRERFAAGIEMAQAYFPEMERIFREEGVPVEITRLPLIESCFNVKAYSKVGAAGVWQFMPATARRFMRVDGAVDERRDPLLSTRAAARYLRESYEDLGAWPLAITGYNHGPAGVGRAVNQLGTRDIVTIIQRYQGPAFKFASRNFYPEFLAALEVERNHRQYFGPLRPRTLPATDRVQVEHYVDINTVSRCAGADSETIARLNPSLSGSVLDGKQLIPAGYTIRVPAGSRERFRAQYAALSGQEKFSSQRTQYVLHRVKRGQTLSTIARQYGSTSQEIRKQNKLGKSQTVRVGQLLRIPAS